MKCNYVNYIRDVHVCLVEPFLVPATLGQVPMKVLGFIFRAISTHYYTP